MLSMVFPAKPRYLNCLVAHQYVVIIMVYCAAGGGKTVRTTVVVKTSSNKWRMKL